MSPAVSGIQNGVISHLHIREATYRARIYQHKTRRHGTFNPRLTAANCNSNLGAKKEKKNTSQCEKEVKHEGGAHNPWLSWHLWGTVLHLPYEVVAKISEIRTFRANSASLGSTTPTRSSKAPVGFGNTITSSTKASGKHVTQTKLKEQDAADKTKRKASSTASAKAIHIKTDPTYAMEPN